MTALFVDIVGSTALLESMDPEDWRAVINEAFERLAPPVRRYDGRIAQYLGDGLLALFGAPVAHEDDAARAALAALEILAAASAYAEEVRARTGLSFGVRLGLDTGEVVAGPVGERGSAEYLAVGDAVNTAARLQSAALPMTALASEHTVRALAGRFIVEDRGPLVLKGRSRPLRAFRLVARAAEAGPEPARPRSETPLVGRSEEMKRLICALDRAGTGRSVAATVVGDPGIGKSRLLAELRAVALDRGARWAEAHGRSYGGATTHDLLAALLRDLSGVGADDGPDRFVGFVEAIAGAGSGAGPTLAEIAWPGTQPPGPSDPRGLLLARRMALRTLVDTAAAERPLVLALEDIHRADPASVAILEALVGRGAAPRLVVMTSRPEPGAPGWALVDAVRALGSAAGVTVDLAAMDAPESLRLVDALLPGAAVPGELATAVVRRAEGNPLFLEELIRSLVDQGAVRREGDRWLAPGSLAPATLPPTILGLLLARIDRLAPETRAAVHVAAVIGRRFSVALLARAGATARLRLPASPAAIEASGLVDPAPDDPDQLTFRHALVQEAAYASLLRVDRARLHGAVARSMAALEPTRLDELAPALAFHYRRAGALGPAIRFALVAGQQALAAHANAEALAAFDDVLAMLGDLPERGRRTRRHAERGAHEGRGDVLGWLHRRDDALAAYGAAEAGLPRGACLDRARLARKRAGLLSSGQRVAEALEAFAAAERMVGVPAQGDDAAGAEWVELHLARASLHYFRGDLAGLEADLGVVGPWIEAAGSPDQQLGLLSELISAAFRRSRYLVDGETVALERRALDLALRIGDPAAIAVREFSLGLALLLRDDLAEVDEHLERALSVAEACEDELLVARILAYRPLLARKRGDVERCRVAGAVAHEMAERLRLPEYVAMATASRAWVAWRDGDAEAARAAAAAATRLWDDGAFRYPFRWVALLPVLALDVEAGDLGAAVAAVAEILEPAQQRLPDRLDSALAASLAARAHGDAGETRAALARSIDAARSLGYL